MTDPTDAPDTPTGLTRRTFSKTAAWAAPVVAVAATAPLAAASLTPDSPIVQVTVATLDSATRTFRVSVTSTANEVPSGSVIVVQLLPRFVEGSPYLDFETVGSPVGNITAETVNPSSYGYSLLNLTFLSAFNSSSTPLTWSTDVQVVNLTPGHGYTGNWNTSQTTDDIGFSGSSGGFYIIDPV